MKKMMFKVITVIVVLAMATSLAACGNTAEEQKESTAAAVSESSAAESSAAKEIPVINIMTVPRDETDVPQTETLVAKKWQEDVGFKMNMTIIPYDAYAAKVNVILSSKDLPDILQLATTNAIDIMNEYGPKGVFACVSDNLDKVPGTQKLMAKLPEYSKIMQAADGKIYGWPGLVYTSDDLFFTTNEVRTDLLEKANIDYKTIDTLDDLTNALRAMKKQLGGKAPWAQRFGYNGFMQHASYMFGTNYREYWDYDTNKMVFPAKAENFKKLVQWLALLYSEGLIHPDWTTLADETWENMRAAGEFGFFNERFIINNTDYKYELIKNPLIDGKRYKQGKRANIGWDDGWVSPWTVNASGKNVDKSLQVVDFLFNEDNVELLTLGIEGESYVKDPGANQTLLGIKWLAKVFGLNKDDPNAKTYDKFGFMYYNFLRTGLDEQANPAVEGYKKYFAFKDEVIKDPGIAPSQPVLKFNEEETQVKKDIETPLNTYFDENIIKFVQGQRPMSEWGAFVSELDKMGLDKVQKAYDAALDRWNKLK